MFPCEALVAEMKIVTTELYQKRQKIGRNAFRNDRAGWIWLSGHS